MSPELDELELLLEELELLGEPGLLGEPELLLDDAALPELDEELGGLVPPQPIIPTPMSSIIIGEASFNFMSGP